MTFQSFISKIGCCIETFYSKMLSGQNCYLMSLPPSYDSPKYVICPWFNLEILGARAFWLWSLLWNSLLKLSFHLKLIEKISMCCCFQPLGSTEMYCWVACKVFLNFSYPSVIFCGWLNRAVKNWVLALSFIRAGVIQFLNCYTFNCINGIWNKQICFKNLYEYVRSSKKATNNPFCLLSWIWHSLT